MTWPCKWRNDFWEQIQYYFDTSLQRATLQSEDIWILSINILHSTKPAKITRRLTRLPSRGRRCRVIMTARSGAETEGRNVMTGCRVTGEAQESCVLTFALLGGGMLRPPLRFLAHLIIHLFRTCCENFRPRSRKVRSPNHVKWPHLIKSLNVLQRYTD